MFALKRAKISEIYRNCLKSMLKYDLILKCFMSSNSKNIDDVLNFMQKKKSTPKIERVKAQMKTAEKLFELMKKDDQVKKCEGDENVTTENLPSKINDLVKMAEVVPQTSADAVEITRPETTPRKSLTRDSAKKEFLDKAKQVAIVLGVDITMTQKELLEAYETKKGDATIPYKKHEEISVREVERLFSQKEKSGLNIFKKRVGEQEISPTLETWNQLKEITLLHASFRPPRNYFDELINWTHQGKLWHFPIDNDQDWKEELVTDFTEHVFLDKHLEPWCPKSGPIRHFMELVTTGLSKNPHLSVQKKKQHIFWYRDYFQSKSKILSELGVLDANINADTKKLEAGGNIS